MAFVSLAKEQLIEKLGLGKFPQEIQEEFLDRSLKLIDKRIKIRLLDVLSDGELKKFKKASEAGEKAAAQWLLENVSGFRNWIEEEVERVKKSIITV